MGELHVNMNITLDGVIQANGGPTEQDGDFEYAGWERPFWDAESGEQVNADVQASDALLLGRTTYDIFRDYWPGKTDEIGLAFDRVPQYVASRGLQRCPGTPAPRSPTWAPRSVTCVSDMSRSTRGAARTCCRPCSARRWSTR